MTILVPWLSQNGVIRSKEQGEKEQVSTRTGHFVPIPVMATKTITDWIRIFISQTDEDRRI